jgi:SAM-dependent methyltransferase
MDERLFERLVGLPPLGSESRQTVPCKICGSGAHFFDVVDFYKSCSQPEIYPFGASGIPVTYYRCSVCSFAFTPFFDDWTPQDFARFVYNDDYSKVDGDYSGIRPKRDAATIAQRLHDFSHLNILDYGSGSGVFADHLRACGFKLVSSYDPFSSPKRPRGQFDVITCFEVLEHTVSPRATLSDVASFLDPEGCVIFSTGIQPSTMGEIRANWWYVAPRNGHVSIYSLNSLARLGAATGLSLHEGSGGTAFSGACTSSATQQILSSVGRRLRFFELTAPGHGAETPAEQATSWHGLEGTGASSFRWTRQANTLWRVQEQPLQPGKLVVTIPVQNEIQSGFANSCRLEVGSKSAPFVRDISLMTATLSIEEPVEAIVRLVTPPPMRPCDLGTVKDARSLGLAISTGGAAPEGKI